MRLVKWLIGWLTGNDGTTSVPTNPVAPPTVPTTAPTVQTLDPVADLETTRTKLLVCHNAARTGVGIMPLVRNSQLDQSAISYAKKMAADAVMSHTDGSTLQQRLAAVGYTFDYAGENIAECYLTVGQVMTGWMNSPPHHANIVNSNYTEVGFGVALSSTGALYWCADFGATERPRTVTIVPTAMLRKRFGQ